MDFVLIYNKGALIDFPVLFNENAVGGLASEMGEELLAFIGKQEPERQTVLLSGRGSVEGLVCNGFGKGVVDIVGTLPVDGQQTILSAPQAETALLDGGFRSEVHAIKESWGRLATSPEQKDHPTALQPATSSKPCSMRAGLISFPYDR